jgi:HrpA-like RNA helicase
MTSFQSTFLKPSGYVASSGNDNLGIERLNEIENEFEFAKFNSNIDQSIDVQRQQLPIYKHRDQILYALETNRVVVIVGETGKI